MKTIGEIIKSARVRKKYSIKKVEDLTKIKNEFINGIEKENWRALPPFATTLGFIKSLAGTLNIDEKLAVAVFKRDYSQKHAVAAPKPDVSKKFVWSPKLTFSIGTLIIVVTVLGYLIFQYIKFLSAPSLTVYSPKENQVVTEGQVEVSGTTDSDAKVIVNNQPVIVDDNGNFSTTLDVGTETHEVDIVATSRSGKITEVRRDIKVEK